MDVFLDDALVVTVGHPARGYSREIQRRRCDNRCPSRCGSVEHFRLARVRVYVLRRNSVLADVEADHAALKQGGGSNGCPEVAAPGPRPEFVSRGGQMVDPQFRRPDETYVAAMVPEWATANAESIALN
jgi:hypothetical protein